MEGDPLAHDWGPRSVLSLVYLAIVGSAIAFVLFFWLLQRIQASQTMLIALVTPLIAMLTGMLVRGEAVSVRIVIGGLAILGGVAVAMLGSIVGASRR